MDENLGKKKIPALLFQLSLPATIAMIVNALYNIVDTIFIGNGVNHLAISALTVALPIQMILLSLAMMVGIGAASAVSRSLGEGNREKANHVAGNSYILVILISLIFTLFAYFNLEKLLLVFGASEDVLPYAKDYMEIILLINVFHSFSVNSNNLVRSEGKAKISMFSMLIGTILNIILDPIFIFTFDMGIKGAALATIIGQMSSFVFLFIYMISGRSSLKIKIHHFRLQVSYAIEILTVGLSSFARQVAGSLLAIVLNNLIVEYAGDISLSTYGIIQKIITFIMMPMFGIVQGMQPIIGYNYGAKKISRVFEVIKLSAMVLFVYSFSMTLMVYAFNKHVFMLFTPNEQVIDIGVKAVVIIMFAVPLISFQIISGAVFQSLGLARPALFLSMLRQIILFIPLLYVLPYFIEPKILGIWYAFPVSDILSTIISVAFLLNRIKILKLDKSLN